MCTNEKGQPHARLAFLLLVGPERLERSTYGLRGASLPFWHRPTDTRTREEGSAEESDGVLGSLKWLRFGYVEGRPPGVAPTAWPRNIGASRGSPADFVERLLGHLDEPLVALEPIS